MASELAIQTIDAGFTAPVSQTAAFLR